MGTHFSSIADDALYAACPLGEPCQHCDRKDQPVFDYDGHVLDPALAADPELARQEPEVFYVCAACVQGGNLRKNKVGLMEALGPVPPPDRERAAEAYHRLPDVPVFLQDKDWPWCCGAWSEFVGCPADYEAARKVPDEYAYWCGQPAPWELTFDLQPESLREISLFVCPGCATRRFVWQST